MPLAIQKVVNFQFLFLSIVSQAISPYFSSSRIVFDQTFRNWSLGWWSPRSSKMAISEVVCKKWQLQMIFEQQCTSQEHADFIVTPFWRPWRQCFLSNCVFLCVSCLWRVRNKSYGNVGGRLCHEKYRAKHQNLSRLSKWISDFLGHGFFTSVLVFVPSNTWLISSLQENECCYKLSNCTKFTSHSLKIVKVVTWV